MKPLQPFFALTPVPPHVVVPPLHVQSVPTRSERTEELPSSEHLYFLEVSSQYLIGSPEASPSLI